MHISPTVRRDVLLTNACWNIAVEDCQSPDGVWCFVVGANSDFWQVNYDLSWVWKNTILYVFCDKCLCCYVCNAHIKIHDLLSLLMPFLRIYRIQRDLDKLAHKNIYISLFWLRNRSHTAVTHIRLVYDSMKALIRANGGMWQSHEDQNGDPH